MVTFCLAISSVQEILFRSRGGREIKIIKNNPEITLIFNPLFLRFELLLLKFNITNINPEIRHNITEEPEEPTIDKKPLREEFEIDTPKESQGNPENKIPLIK